MQKELILGLVQHQGCAEREASLEKSMNGIREAAKQGAQLVLLQELHTGLYFCQREELQHFDLAETIPGPSTEKLSQLARELNVVIVSSLFEKRAAGVYHNTSVVIEKDGSIAGKYRKMHIPDDPGYYEKYYFTPGDIGFAPISTSVGRIGVLICWDQWFPEAARLMALAGAEILLYPTAIGWIPEDDVNEQAQQREAWRTIQRAHAIANGIPVAVCNRVGVETVDDNHIQFWGSSFICGPQGEILAEAPIDKETVLVSSISKLRTEQVRRMWPYLRDRRIDAYQGLLERYLD